MRPLLDGLEFKRLSLEHSYSLEIPFSEGEIKDVVGQEILIRALVQTVLFSVF